MSDDEQSAAIQWSKEAVTPACNLANFTKAHWESLQGSYGLLAKRLNLPKVQVPRLIVDSGSTIVYDEIRDGVRHMAWCPSGIDLLTNIFPMLMRRGIAMNLPTKIDKNFMLELVATRDKAWMLWSAEGKGDALAHGESGVFRRLPSAIQIVYLIVWLISMMEDGRIQSDSVYPFKSKSISELQYVRSSTVNGEKVIGVAYLPWRAVLFEAFPVDNPPPNLVTPDIFLL
ncbi:MAG: hypothetical protein PHC53_05450 [Patescibacteria group bacterium]|nr:hypothetical protein [Patescibacteria group bacterium]